VKIAITSQNFRTITGHAGKTTHFLVFEGSAGEALREVERLDLPAELMMHAFRGTDGHPLQAVDALITGGAGEGFVRRLGAWGVRVAITSETDPTAAVRAFLKGELAPATGPEGHHHHGGSGGCGHD
jgi:predicted Fe-Mo cluster-binding NifX family protein